MRKRGVVLVFGGHDPSGGAGVAADAQVINGLGHHAVSVLTAITAQSPRGVSGYLAIAPEWVEAQGDALIRDMDIVAIKTGMLCNPAVVRAVCNLIDRCAGVPLVVDPVISAGSGHTLADPDCATAIRELLAPRATVLTPNIGECLALGGGQGTDDQVDAAARDLLDNGCGSVLVTATDGTEGEHIIHRLYRGLRDAPVEYRFARLPHTYHGSGCTLAAALSVYLARGDALEQAVPAALDLTWRTLNHAYSIGAGQLIPRRVRS